jgi:hypothetical protein
MVVLSPTTTAVVLAAYVTHGRFTVPKDCPRLEISTVGATLEMPAKETEVESAQSSTGRSSSYASGHMELDPQR